MGKSEVEKLTDEKIAKGGVLVKFYFDMQHKDKDKLQPLMADLINERLMKEKGVVYCYGSIEEPLKRDDVYTTSAMVTVLFESFFPLIGVAFNYAPAGVEVLRPEKEMRFSTAELQSLILELSQISVTYSKYILEHVMKPDEIDSLSKSMETRAEVGKKFLGKKDDEQAA
ncbi:MAG: hypothetical protein QW814_00140 [Methanothrix sp.]